MSKVFFCLELLSCEYVAYFPLIHTHNDKKPTQDLIFLLLNIVLGPFISVEGYSDSTITGPKGQPSHLLISTTAIDGHKVL